VGNKVDNAHSLGYYGCKLSLSSSCALGLGPLSTITFLAWVLHHYINARKRIESAKKHFKTLLKVQLLEIGGMYIMLSLE